MNAIGELVERASAAWRRVVVVVLLSVYLFPGDRAMASDEAAERALLDSIQTLSESKSLTENRVKLLRALSAEGELSQAELLPLKVSYGEARARVNASFERLLVELEVLQKDPLQDSIETLAERAGDEMTAFIEASDTVSLANSHFKQPPEAEITRDSAFPSGSYGDQ